MPPQHLDRLSALDASFLAQERESSHMHIGGLALLEGPPPTKEEVLDQIRSRLHLVPRYRQRLEVPALQSGRPLWVDDPEFDLGYHVRHTALPRPGSVAQLERMTSRLFSQRLDRSRPLWELWLVEGLDDGRFAIISKTHHALIDGVSGVDLLTVIFDLGPVPTEVPHSGRPWAPAREPDQVGVLARGALGAARAGVRATARLATAATRPAESLESAREVAAGVTEFAWQLFNPAPATPLNVPIGPHRRFTGIDLSLADFKEVKAALGGTVNDVVLTVVAGGLRTWLRGRGVRTQGLELRALVPVSVRTRDESGSMGNKLVAMRGPLPVYIADPGQRLDEVRATMDGLKESKQAVGAEVLVSVQDLAPPTVLARASRLNFSTRLFNLLVTNVPGPQFPLYLRGHQLQELYPVAFLPEGHALAVAIMSYDGGLRFGLLGDLDAMHDLDVLADGIRSSLEELLALARQGASAPVAASAATGD